jgi:hypothetical protein
VTHILRPGKASEKTPKGVIPPSLREISQNASRKKTHFANGGENEKKTAKRENMSIVARAMELFDIL